MQYRPVIDVSKVSFPPRNVQLPRGPLPQKAKNIDSRADSAKLEEEESYKVDIPNFISTGNKSIAQSFPNQAKSNDIDIPIRVAESKGVNKAKSGPSKKFVPKGLGALDENRKIIEEDGYGEAGGKTWNPMTASLSNKMPNPQASKTPSISNASPSLNASIIQSKPSTTVIAGGRPAIPPNRPRPPPGPPPRGLVIKSPLLNPK
jgi:hypothetical protein